MCEESSSSKVEDEKRPRNLRRKAPPPPPPLELVHTSNDLDPLQTGKRTEESSSTIIFCRARVVCRTQQQEAEVVSQWSMRVRIIMKLLEQQREQVLAAQSLPTMIITSNGEVFRNKGNILVNATTPTSSNGRTLHHASEAVSGEGALLTCALHEKKRS